MPRNGATFGNRYYFPYQNKADGLVMHVASVDEKGNFQSVGSFPARGGVVTTYKDRLVFGAWGDRKTIARVYVSSPYPFSAWKPFFSFDQYEPDVGAALTYDTGAMQEHHGWLYFGTINGPLLAIPNEIKSMGPIPDPVNAVGGERSVAVFRARDIETDQPVIENLYGRKAYPAHVSPMPSSLPLRPGLWVAKKTGMAPKCGPAGFGNPDNRYIWSMASMGDRVYVGTMDMTTTLLSSAIDLVEKLGLRVLQAAIFMPCAVIPDATKSSQETVLAILSSMGFAIFWHHPKGCTLGAPTRSTRPAGLPCGF